MNPSFSTSQLYELIEACREGTATAAQHVRLEEVLRDDPTARQQYMRYLRLCADLRTLATGATPQLSPLGPSYHVADTAAASRPVSWTVGPFGAGRWTWPLLVGAGLLLGLLVWAGHQRLPGMAGREAERPAYAAVATLAAAMDPEWAGGKSVPPGTELPSGEVQLQRGLAEIRFGSGAVVILEGPVGCRFDSPYRLTLHHGRLSAKVPLQAIGFTVQTPQATVVDLGTEFGVSSEDAGATDVHVFRGQVALGSRLDLISSRRLLGEGTAKRIEAGSRQLDDIRANELAFVRQQEFEARVKARQNSPYHCWLAQSYRLRREPALVLYYTFDSRAASAFQLLNRAGATAGKLDALLGHAGDAAAPQWTAGGRWPEQRALFFSASGYCWARVPHRNELNITQAMTVAAWIRPNTALLGDAAAILAKVSASGNDEPNYELGVCRQRDADGNALCSAYLQCGAHRVESPAESLAPGSWTHLAASSDRGHTRLYINGRLVVESDGGRLLPNAGDLWIGSAGPRKAAAPPPQRPFEGLIGELLLVRRAMSSEEIMAMYSGDKQLQ
jgi:hypothetical protein